MALEASARKTNSLRCHGFRGPLTPSPSAPALPASPDCFLRHLMDGDDKRSSTTRLLPCGVVCCRLRSSGRCLLGHSPSDLASRVFWQACPQGRAGGRCFCERRSMTPGLFLREIDPYIFL